MPPSRRHLLRAGTSSPAAHGRFHEHLPCVRVYWGRCLANSVYGREPRGESHRWYASRNLNTARCFSSTTFLPAHFVRNTPFGSRPGRTFGAPLMRASPPFRILEQLDAYQHATWHNGSRNVPTRNPAVVRTRLHRGMDLHDVLRKRRLPCSGGSCGGSPCVVSGVAHLPRDYAHRLGFATRRIPPPLAAVVRGGGRPYGRLIAVRPGRRPAGSRTCPSRGQCRRKRHRVGRHGHVMGDRLLPRGTPLNDRGTLGDLRSLLPRGPRPFPVYPDDRGGAVLRCFGCFSAVPAAQVDHSPQTARNFPASHHMGLRPHMARIRHRARSPQRHVGLRR